MRNNLRNGTFAAAALVIGLSACSQSERQEARTEVRQATETAASTIDNAALTTKVKAAFLADELVKGTQVSVDSSNGVVTLSGTVDSAAHKVRAEQIARDVSGVTRVQNNLSAGAAGTTTGMTNSPTPTASMTDRTSPPSGKQATEATKP